MDGTGSSHTEEMVEITFDTSCPLIQTFFERITEGQWYSLTSGSPDDSTRILLAQLLLQIKQAAANTLVAVLKNSSVVISEEQVEGKLSETLIESFTKVLEIENLAECASFKCMTHLLAKEVTESVGINQRLTPQDRLDDMLCHATKILETFSSKMPCTPRSRRQRTSRTSSVCTTALTLEDLEDTEDIIQLLDTTEEPPQDPFMTETVKIVQEIIEIELTEFIEPLLQDVTDSEYELLLSEFSVDIEVVVKDIAQLIVSEVKEKVASPESKHVGSLEGAGSMIRDFFVKQLIKAFIAQIVAQVKAKFHSKFEAESSQSMQSLIASIDSLFVADDGNKDEEIFSGSDITALIKDLTTMIANFINNGTRRPKAVRGKAATRSQVNAAMCATIQQKVSSFLALMNWWRKTQATSHSTRVTLALQEESSSLSSGPFSLETLSSDVTLVETHSDVTSEEDEYIPAAQEDTEETKKKKGLVKVLLGNIVSRLVKKAKVSWTPTKSEVIVQRLYQRIWAEVEEADFRITPEILKELSQAVLTDLVKKWGSAEALLVLMNLEEPATEKLIATCVSERLMAPVKKQSAIKRVFSSVGKALSKPLRMSHRVGVL
ncbi:uncharacterized protein LOC121897596 [Scomber scombrus]|uniref:Uncharacterized protein LOC121897596 n=1 Tax=Scomber scombrus TaxID=13677 RepID=A0AAV1P7J5_SCOSC